MWGAAMKLAFMSKHTQVLGCKLPAPCVTNHATHFIPDSFDFKIFVSVDALLRAAPHTAKPPHMHNTHQKCLLPAWWGMDAPHRACARHARGALQMKKCMMPCVTSIACSRCQRHAHFVHAGYAPKSTLTLPSSPAVTSPCCWDCSKATAYCHAC